MTDHKILFVVVRESHYNYLSSVHLQIKHSKCLEIAFLIFGKLLVLDIADIAIAESAHTGFA